MARREALMGGLIRYGKLRDFAKEMMILTEEIVCVWWGAGRGECDFLLVLRPCGRKKKWHFWKIERRSLWLNCGKGKVDLDKMEDVDRSREYRTLLTILCLLISILSVMERSWRVLRRSITDCYFQFQKITLKAFWKMDWKGQKWMWRDLIKSVLQ